MRPRSVYAVFADGKVTAICTGLAEAKTRAQVYKKWECQTATKRFATQLDAEEFAAWWNERRAVNDERVKPVTALRR